MNLPIKASPSAVGHREDWMPDPGVALYVRDVLKEDFGIEVDHLPEHWIPLAVVGTLDWVVICGWWLYRNTGIFDTDEQSKWVFRWENYEFDPDQLFVFKEDPSRHKFEERMQNPGIDGKERTEALQFLLRDVFEVWYKHYRGYTEEMAEEFFPPQEFVEVAMYATFLWILDEYGRDWISAQDQVFGCVFDFGVAYLSRWDNTLLDPRTIVCTKRKLNSCCACGEVLWCVGGTDFQVLDTSVDHPVVKAILRSDTDADHSTASRWAHLCNSCAVSLSLLDGVRVDEHDRRIQKPSCPHWAGLDGEAGTCMSTCPHSGNNPQRVWERLEDVGTERLKKYRERVAELGGTTPRMAAGQTLEGIIDHFRGARGDGRSFTPRRRKELEG